MEKYSAIIIAVSVICFIGFVLYFIYRAKKTMKDIFGTSNLKELASQRKEQEENTPKSLGGTTSLILPRLSKDFPELSWSVLRGMGEEELVKYLKEKEYTDIKIHGTVMSDYTKRNGLCQVTMKSAVQYYREGQKIQDRFAVVYSYIQNADAFGYDNGVSFTCPKCGAPIKSLGMKICAYCGAAVEPLSLRVWKFDRIFEA